MVYPHSNTNLTWGERERRSSVGIGPYDVQTIDLVKLCFISRIFHENVANNKI